MVLLNIFKTPKIRRFEYKPVYWDPAKERREERLERAKHELGMRDENSAYTPMIRKGVFREQRKTVSYDRQSGIFRFLIVAFVVLALLYWIL